MGTVALVLVVESTCRSLLAPARLCTICYRSLQSGLPFEVDHSFASILWRMHVFRLSSLLFWESQKSIFVGFLTACHANAVFVASCTL